MNIVEPLRSMFGWQARPGTWALPLGPGRWRVLFGRKDHPLLLPAAGRRLQRRSLAHFVPGGWKALYARVLLRADAAFPAVELLPEFKLSEGARGFLNGRLPFPSPAHSAVRIGAPGPGQKAAVLLLSETGEGLALAKLAMTAGADHQVTAEAGWLRELRSVPEIEEQVPRLLAEGVALNGRRYLVMSLAPIARMTRAFTPAHAAFLGALGRAGGDVKTFSASPCYAYLEKTLARVATHLTRAERTALQNALRDCRAVLANWTGPFVHGHGDFVPWNIRLDGNRIFVFDWECARTAANPLADAFHYFVMQRAASGGTVSSYFMAATTRRVEKIARQLYPEWTWHARVVSALGLAYLLEVLLRDTAASRNLVRSDPVMAGYLRLLEQRPVWRAA